MPRAGRHGSSGRSEERRGGRTELGKRKREAAGGGEEAGVGERKQRRREEERSPFRSRYTYWLLGGSYVIGNGLARLIYIHNIREVFVVNLRINVPVHSKLYT